MAVLQQQRAQLRKVPWYSLDPRHMHAWHILFPVLCFLFISMFQEKHLWKFDWAYGYHARYNCRSVTDAAGLRRAAWRWVEGREVHVYVTGGKSRKACRTVAFAMQQLNDELGLELQVYTLPAPPRVLTALARSTKMMHGRRVLNFTALCRELVCTRKGEYAEVVFTPDVIDGATDVVGSSVFSYGVVVLDARRATLFTARHEAAHLLGYNLHDTWPLFVFGYPTSVATSRRDCETLGPLMGPGDNGYVLSARSRDALICFWDGLEARTHQRYFAPANLTLAKKPGHQYL